MTVYFLNPSPDDEVHGGVRVIFQQAEALVAAGVDAAVVSQPTFRPWFESAAPTVEPPVDVGDGDLLALAETYGDGLNTIAPGVPRVTLLLSSYFALTNVRDPAAHPYRTCPWLVGAVTFSEATEQDIRWLFPDLAVTRLHYGIDPQRFGFQPGPRRQRVGYMPRKRGHEAAWVLAMLDARGLGDWEHVAIAGGTDDEVAAAMASCPLFLSFSEHEGFGLPPVEALARGCYVIGYSGYGGDEYFDPRFTTKVPDGDSFTFGRAVERWIRDDGWDEDRAREASGWVLARYDPVRADRLLAEFFERALKGASALPPARGTIVAPEVSPVAPTRRDDVVRHLRGAAHHLRRAAVTATRRSR